MILQDLLEGVSRTLYHYTGLWAATQILESGQIQLSSTLGTDVEQSYAPPGYPYFLSATRTLTGGYHDFVGSTAVMFVLDGSWFNARYPGRAVDYWGNRDPLKMHHRRHEAEDRIFSREPDIPLGGVRAVHVLVKPDAEPTHRARARRLLIAAKRRGIPAYLYQDEQSWRRLDRAHTVSVASLAGADDSGRSWSRGHRGYLMPWMELIFGKTKDRLSDRADKIRYNLNYDFYKQDAIRSLAADLSNARKPNSGPDREHVAKIIALMRRERLTTLTDLARWVRDRWAEKPAAVDENFADGRVQGRSRPGRVKRAGASCAGSVTDLRKHAKKSGGERGRMYHWCANMKSGQARKNK